MSQSISSNLSSNFTLLDSSKTGENARDLIYRTVRVLLSSSAALAKDVASDQSTYYAIEASAASLSGKPVDVFNRINDLAGSSNRAAQLVSISTKALPYFCGGLDLISGLNSGESFTKATLGAVTTTGVGLLAAAVIGTSMPFLAAAAVTSGASFVSGWTMDRVVDHFENNNKATATEEYAVA